MKSPRREQSLAALLGLWLHTGAVLALLLLTPGFLPEPRTLEAGAPFSSADTGARRLHDALLKAGQKVVVVQEGQLPPSSSTLLLLEPRRRPDEKSLKALESSLLLGSITLVAAGTSRQLELLPESLRPARMPPMVLVQEPVKLVRELPFGPKFAGLLLSAESRDLRDPLASLTAFAEVPFGATVLGRTAPGGFPVLFAWPVGSRGQHVFLLSDPRLFENRWLHQLDNVELLSALIAGHSTLAMDGRWLAGRHGKRPLMALIYGTPGGRAVILLALGLILGLYLSGLQPGGPCRQGRQARHPLDYLDSMAALLQSSGPPEELVAPLQKRFLAHAAHRLGLDPESPRRTIGAAVAARAGVPVRLAQETLTRLPPRSGIQEWVARMDRWEKVL